MYPPIDAEFVRRAKENAKKHPVHPPAPPTKSCLFNNVALYVPRPAPTNPDEPQAVDCYVFNLMLTYDVLGDVNTWHLSIGYPNHQPIPQAVSQQVATLFFKPPFKLLPKHLFPPALQFMDQYVKVIEDEDD